MPLRTPLLTTIILLTLLTACTQPDRFLQTKTVSPDELSQDFKDRILSIISEPLFKQVDLSKSKFLSGFQDDLGQIGTDTWRVVLFPERDNKVMFTNTREQASLTVYGYNCPMKAAFERFTTGMIKYENDYRYCDIWIVQDDDGKNKNVIFVDFSFPKIVRVSFLNEKNKALGQTGDYKLQDGWMEYTPDQGSY